MYGAPQMSADFAHLPYVNPDAPQGGMLTFPETGTFDSLNPFVLKGSAPWAQSSHMVESLLARSYGEPFTLYGLLAETVETPEDRSWVSFTLRPEARFSDGSPVTVEDVIWSFETLGTEGHPRYRNTWKGISSIEQTGPRSVRITLSEPNRELPLIIGLRPILQKAQWQGRPFAEDPMEAPIGSGPYLIDRFEAGRFVEFRRNPDWWGRDLPINRGLNNFERVRYEYYRSGDAVWEAVRNGKVSMFGEGDPKRWATEYTFPLAVNGGLVQHEITNQRPTGMKGFVFNTRRALFEDRRVREALTLSFDWEWVNARLYAGQYARMQSFFGTSPLGFSGPAGPVERAILAPFADTLPEGLLEAGWTPPVSDGSGRDRRLLRRAARLLDAAGWTLVDGERRNADGDALSFEILVASTSDETLASLWREQVARLGVSVSVRLVDAAQYKERRDSYDFDMIVNRWSLSLSPGTEQRYYFGSAGREDAGTRNYMGAASPAIDAAIEALLASRTRADFLGATRALDRVLTGGIYVIPFGTLPVQQVAALADIRRPETDSLYGFWGWWAGPGVWWHAGGG